jgi:hypothetical protein
MTKIILLAIIAALASPAAFAASKKHRPRANAWDAYAQAQQRQTQRPSPNSRFDVYGTSGEYIGSDPDPLVRQMLQREGN